MYAELARVDGQTWAVTVSLFNDEPLVGIAVPLKLDAGLVKIVADSAIYTGGRVAEAKFNTARFRADTAIQCVTLGMLANIGPTDNQLAPGKGRLATVFVSSVDGVPVGELTVDTTTTEPHSTLMLIAHNSEVADILVDSATPPHDKFNRRMITPVWVVKKAQ